MIIKRVLVIRSGALGETIFALPVIEALRYQYGLDIVIDWVGTPSASTLFKLDKRINKVFHLKHRKLPIFLSSEKRLIINESKKQPYDLLINLESGRIFFSLAEKIVAKHKLGMPFNQIRPLPSAHVIESLKTIYETAVEASFLINSYPVLFGDPTENIRDEFELPKNYIVINPSTSHHKKFTHRAWPLEYWKELIARLAAKYHLVVIGAQGEETFFNHLRPFDPSVIDLVGKTNLTQLITIIQEAEAIITADTGPSHIASAVNTRTFALFGPSNPEGTGPYKTPYNDVHIISMQLECSPCNTTSRIKTCHDNQCMKQITPSMLEMAIEPYVTPKQ